MKSYYHCGGMEPLRGGTIAEHFADVVRRFPEQEAIVSLPQEKRLSYRELADAVDELAKGLLGIGFTKGDRIGLWSTNNIEWLLVQMAIAHIGAVLVNINPAYRLQELAYALKLSEVQGIFTIPAFRSSDYVAILVELLPELKLTQREELANADLPFLRRVIVYDPADPGQSQRPYAGFTTWPEVIGAGKGITMERLNEISGALDRDDPINIQYTSGTTGFPKAVALTHHNILNNAWFSAQALHLTEADRLCVPVPFYHCFGTVLANLLCLSVGACIVIPAEHFDALATLKAIEEESCTAIHGVPTMFIAELEHPDFKNFDMSTLRTGIMAGAPCLPQLMKRVMEDMHCPEILIGYGETEASPITHLTTRADSMELRTETVGKNLPHQEVKIVHLATGATVPLGEIGEICFRGYHIMQGYYGQADKTAEVIDKNGWLYSGDLGTMDAHGYVRITGRCKEMIIRGGENIYPKEIEDFLFSHPGVIQVAVFGVPDEYYGEEIMAWIQLRPDEICSEEEIRNYCRDKISHFKIPKYIRFVDEFPMTVTGKLQKFRMREMAIVRMGLKA
ncbi:fatty acid CoA ligase family protein [Desulfotalea psychrophila]|nr:fatty acid CoA ligase family protein [Desulfotalea psychrophila]